jgi:death-on-curing protein
VFACESACNVWRKILHRTLFEKAAAYGYRFCHKHPFVDGNKRVAFVLMDMFLHQDGWNLTASEQDAYSTVVSLVGGSVSKTERVAWLEAHSSKFQR